MTGCSCLSRVSGLAGLCVAALILLAACGSDASQPEVGPEQTARSEAIAVTSGVDDASSGDPRASDDAVQSDGDEGGAADGSTSTAKSTPAGEPADAVEPRPDAPEASSPGSAATQPPGAGETDEDSSQQRHDSSNSADSDGSASNSNPSGGTDGSDGSDGSASNSNPSGGTDGTDGSASNSNPSGGQGSGGDPSDGSADVVNPSGDAASVFPRLADDQSMARWTVEIVESFPHDRRAFTQGLEVFDGAMYESTGLWGRSTVRVVEPRTGEVLSQASLADEYFGEGLTVQGDQVIQLTWRKNTAFVYDRFTLRETARHSYEGEGWGLCSMTDVLIMSNGSDRLARRDPVSFALLDEVTVTAPGYEGRLDFLNELECLDGLVIANVWQSSHLLVIDPESGRVMAEVDASPLIDEVTERVDEQAIDVLNGVAAARDGTATLWMTGKLWPRLYRVRLVAAQR